MFPFVALLCLLSAGPAATQPDIFIEAEACRDHDFGGPAEFPKVVSGDQILRLWTGTPPPGDGYHARFPFEVAEPGRYHAWAAASLPGATSSFWWRIDKGPWGHMTVDTLPAGIASFGVSTAMGWIELTTTSLQPGPHELTIRVNERRDGLERAYLLYLDAILITPRNVYPSGLVTPADLPRLKPPPAPPVPVRRAGKPGPPMLLGTSVMGAVQNHVVRSIGFSLSQTDSQHLDVNETSPGVWDWTEADAGLAACRKAGLQWQYFPHFHWPPAWYRKTAAFVPCRGLRSGKVLACMSIWSPSILRRFDEGYAAMAAHYGGSTKNVAAIYLSIHGDFGEATYPAGYHPDETRLFGKEGTAEPDYWCGDDDARTSFRDLARARYGSVEKLNAAWGTSWGGFDAVDYPPNAYGRPFDVRASARNRRRWLDFIDWYYDSMTRFTADVTRIARKHFPQSLLVVPLGNGDENVLLGQDNTGIPKALRGTGAQMRSTHGGYLPFAQNSASMLNRIATAARFYGEAYWSEPPGGITPEGEVGRFMEAVSLGSWGYWDWGQNPVGAVRTFQEFGAFLTRERPLIDAALFYPTTDHRLHPETGYPQGLAAVGPVLRDVLAYDIVDERLVEDGALNRYRVLAWPEGDYVSAGALAAIVRWVKAGGVLVVPAGLAPRFVDGDETAGTEVAGRASGPVRVGAGLVVQASAPVPGQPTAIRAFCEAIRWAVRRKAPARAELDAAYDGVYATPLANGEVILYNSTAGPVTKAIGRAKVVVPAHSLRSAMMGGAVRGRSR